MGNIKFDSIEKRFIPAAKRIIDQKGECGNIYCKNCPLRVKISVKNSNCNGIIDYIATDDRTYLEQKVKLCEEYIHLYDNKVIDDSFKKYGIPVENRYENFVNEIIKDKGSCISVNHKSDNLCEECPYSSLNNGSDGMCPFKNENYNTKINNKMLLNISIRYIELLHEKYNYKPKDKILILNLVEIMNNKDLCADIFKLSRDVSSVDIKKIYLSEDKNTCYAELINHKYKLMIEENGDVYSTHESYYIKPYNQRKIQKLLEPYWIEDINVCPTCGQKLNKK
jgi:hypothetical protein